MIVSDGDADLRARGPPAAPCVVRQELVQRRIEQADGGRETLEGLEDAGEVLALIGEELGEGLLPVGHVVGEDHFAHGVDAVALEEHVLGAGEADAGGAERDGVSGLLRGVGIGADGQRVTLRAPLHELEEVLELLGLLRGFVAADEAGDDFGRRGLELAAIDGAGGAVDGQEVAFLEGLAGDLDGLACRSRSPARRRRRRRPCPSGGRRARRARRRRPWR